MSNKISISIICLLGYLKIIAQDPQFSQFYNSPMVINPAFTGTTECFRFGAQARSQWVGLDKPFNTGLLYVDVNAFPINSGFGVMALHDQIGHAKIATTELSGLYSYHVKHKGYNLQLGLQGTYVNRSIDYTKLVFEDQFSGVVFTEDFTYDPITSQTKASYADFSAGALFYTDDHYWIGASAHHLNTPNQGFLTNNASLPVKFSLHGGMVFQKEMSMMNKSAYLTIYPCVLYKAQTTFDQLDIGAFAYYHTIMFGIFYRGLIFKKYKGVLNNDAIQFHLGYNYHDWKFYYSYDLTTSRLNPLNTWGTHEITLLKNFCIELWPHHQKTPMKDKLLACPDFKHSALRKQVSWKTQWDAKHKTNEKADKHEIHHHNKVRRKNVHHR
jgi:type IX secretion system PorP/SprF family membrane protein